MRRYNYKSEFSLKETFTDDGKKPIQRPDCDYTITYYTNRSTTYTASVINGACTNCELDPDGNSVIVFFKDHGLSRGVLQREIAFEFPDGMAPSKPLTLYVPGCTNIELWDGRNIYGDVAESSIFLPYLKGDKGDKGDDGDPGTIGKDGKSAYQIAVDHGFDGTEQEWLDSFFHSKDQIPMDNVTGLMDAIEALISADIVQQQATDDLEEAVRIEKERSVTADKQLTELSKTVYDMQSATRKYVRILTTEQYRAIGEKDSNTIYFITE